MRRIALALWSLSLAGGAWAQLSGSLGIVSDYRYRGVSLSDGKPAAQLGVAYDGADGWYAGAFASTADFGRPARDDVQVLPYAGYAASFFPGLAWDAGLSYSAFLRNHDYAYPELYWGLATDHLRARLSYARRYFGEDRQALYLELDGSRPLAEHLHLTGHAGFLRVDGQGYTYDQTDFRVGFSLDLDQAHVALSWVAADARELAYALGVSRDRATFVLSITRPF